MTGHNKRKHQVLDYICRYPDSTSADLASALDIEIHNARTLLKKYHRQGLLRRRKVDRWGTRTYEITEKGLKRRKWLGSHETPAKKLGRSERASEDKTREKEKKSPAAAPKPLESERISTVDVRARQVERLRRFAELLKQLEVLKHS